MWNPPNHQRTNRESKELITLMNKVGLILQSELGIPTFN